MVGPSLRMRWTAIPMATSAARIGMIQIDRDPRALPRHDGGLREARRDRRAQPCWTCRSARGIPDQAGVEGLRREHRQHHHRHEEHAPRGRAPPTSAAGAAPSATMNASTNTSSIDHRPDELDQLVEPRAIMAVLDRAALHRHQQVAERDAASRAGSSRSRQAR